MNGSKPTGRFVVLRHEGGPMSQRPLHWDFMIEVGGALRTWALASAPAADEAIAAEPLSPHRLAYLDFEGEIAGERGSVTQWDRGKYHLRQESDDCIEVELSGRLLRGTARLERETAASAHWVFRFSSGRAATSG